jgi:DNA gyrase subunit A
MREKRIEGISEVRDESDREGIRVVVELKRDVFPQVVLNQLYRMTDLQTSFGVINLSIANGRPEVLDLKQTLVYFIDHRREVVTRRCRYELRQAEAQRELVLGLGMATSDIDRVVRTIRASRDVGRPRDQPARPAAARASASSCAARAAPRPSAPRPTPRATTTSPSARPRPSSRCASRA